MKQVVFIVITLIAFGCSSSKPLLTKELAVKTPISNVDNLANSAELKNAHLGIAVYNITKQQWLQQYQHNKYFIPASTTKLFSCYTAMKYLGDSLVGAYITETKDSLFITPNADPTTLHKDFITQPLQQLLQSVKKTIAFSHTNFNTNALGFGWAWDDYIADYMAERSEMPLYGNTVDFSLENSKLKIVPPYFSNQQLANAIVAQKWDIERDFFTNNFRIIEGSEKDVTTSFTTFDNDRVKAEQQIIGLWREALKNDNIYYTNTTIKGKPIYSQPTDSLLKIMMHRSDNFFAEQTLLMASNTVLGEMNEAKMIAHLLKNELKDIPQKPKWVDGSGLSRYNLFTPESMVFLLGKMYAEIPWNRITTILPTGGTGTITNYYLPLKGRIFAKTGTLSNNVALSGFIQAKSGAMLSFSVLVNNHLSNTTSIRKAVEAYLINIAETN